MNCVSAGFNVSICYDFFSHELDYESVDSDTDTEDITGADYTPPAVEAARSIPDMDKTFSSLGYALGAGQGMRWCKIFILTSSTQGSVGCYLKSVL
jgi:hypothetical protein